MTTTQPPVTGPAIADAVMSTPSPETQKADNAHRKSARAIAIR